MIYDNMKLVKKVTLIVLMLMVVVTVGWMIYYWISHGRIVVNVPDGVSVKGVSYCNCNPVCGSMTETESSSVAVESGNYVVQVLLDNNTSYIANVSVGGWLSSAAVTPKTHTFSVSPVATNTNEYILPVGDSYFTYSLESTGRMVNSDQLWSQVVGAQHIDRDRLLIVQQQTSHEAALAGSLVRVYDSKTGTTTIVGQSEESATRASVLYGNDAMYILGRDNRKVVKVSSDNMTDISIPDGVAYAKLDDWPIMTINDELAAVLSGNDFVPLDDGESRRGTKPSVITLYDTDGFSVKKSIDIGVRSDIMNLSLSPDNKKIAVVGERSIEVYGADSAKLEFSTPISSGGTDSLFWRDNTSFIYSLDMGGIYLADLGRQEAYSIIDNDLLRITSLSGLVDGKVYLTAFPNKEGNVEKTSPDGYIIDLTTEIAGPSTEDTEGITRSLPYDAPGYSIRYHFTGTQVILDIDAAQGYRNQAVGNMYRLGFDPGNYPIEFKDHTNPFKEVE